MYKEALVPLIDDVTEETITRTITKTISDTSITIPLTRQGSLLKNSRKRFFFGSTSRLTRASSSEDEKRSIDN